MTNTNLSSRSPRCRVRGWVQRLLRIAVQRLAKVLLAYIAARRSGRDDRADGYIRAGISIPSRSSNSSRARRTTDVRLSQEASCSGSGSVSMWQVS